MTQAVAALEARTLLVASKKRKVQRKQSEPTNLEIVLPVTMQRLFDNFEHCSVATSAGPRASIGALAAKLHCQSDKDDWCSKARIGAIIGSCSRSLPSVKSGCRCYFAFAQSILGKTQEQALPPTLDELLAWSGTFRCHDTFGNYVSYVKVGTLLMRRSVAVFDNDVLRRAKRSIKNREGFKRRERLFIQLDLVREIVARCSQKAESVHWGMLFLFTYVFLLRLPSEAIPVVRGCVGSAQNEKHANIVYLEDGLLCLRLKRRKNKPGGSLLKRACWCSQCERTCPVHVLWPFFMGVNVGQAAFPGVSAGIALRQLKVLLRALGQEDYKNYRCHDLRRGHAKDMQMNGANLNQILAAGEWRSPAFLQYLSMTELELGAVIEAHQAESSSEDES